MTELFDDNPKATARDLIDQIAEQTHELEATEFERPSDGRARRIVLASAIVLSGAFLAWDHYTQPAPVPVFDEATLAAGLEFTLYLTVSGLEVFRERTGALPATLQEAGLDHPSLVYETSAEGYRVEATNQSLSLVFSEGDDLGPLEKSFWALQRRGAD